METRRKFLKQILVMGGLVAFDRETIADVPSRKPMKESLCAVYRTVNGSPGQNMTKLVEIMGGIDRIIGRNDIVIIKPNVQWWNQGAPNLLSLKTFVELIMDRSGGFRGEVVLAENCHRGQDPAASKSSGWATQFERNAGIAGVNNMNDLAGLLKKKYGDRFSNIHWIDAARGGKRVFGPADGNGYVYCDGTGGVPLIACDNGREGNDYRATIMTYPIFTTDSGTVVDFKNGIWEKGSYTNRPLRFINFSALNHHSTYCGVTSSVKNYMGVTDLSGGPDPHQNGRLAANYHNFHSFPFNEWSPGPEPGMLGKEIGVFIKEIRKADLNVTTAEWIGLTSRIEPPVVHSRTILASTDPVALDYHAAKYILHMNSGISVHNPDNTRGPLYQYLKRCAEAYQGFLDEGNVQVLSYDLMKGKFQADNELAVIGSKVWGSNLKQIMKYLYLKLFS